jgi:transposase-like protein
MAKQGQKLTDELKEKIKAHLASGGNIRETARALGVSPSTVKKVKEEKPDEFERLRTEKREELIDVIYDDMKDALTLGRQKIKIAQVALDEFKPTIDKLIELLSDKDDVKGNDIIEVIKAISSITSIPLGQISTYFGTLYDKRALMRGDPTNNTNHSGSMTHRHISDMSDEDLERIANGAV